LPGLGWSNLNLLITIGAFILATGFFLTLLNMIKSRSNGRQAGTNPWKASSLEWKIPSPPPSYTFLDVPVLPSGGPSEDEEPEGAVRGFDASRRELLMTNVVDGSPDYRYTVPGPSIWPFLLGLTSALTFAGIAFDVRSTPIGAVLSIIALIGWFWPTGKSRLAQTAEIAE